MPAIDRKPAIFLANQLRLARLAALADAEAFDGIIHVVERIGSYLSKEELGDKGKHGTLGNSTFKMGLTIFAAKSALALPSKDCRDLLTPFTDLYELVRQARNDALHQGAFARNLTRHAIELAIILEDALSTQFNPTVADFMVQDPTCGELWQPVAFIRQQMLANSYSYLPVLGAGKEWLLVSDASLARFLGPDRDGNDRRLRLATTLEDAAKASSHILEPAIVLPADATIDEALEVLKTANVMLVKHSDRERLLGILTAFDLL